MGVFSHAWSVTVALCCFRVAEVRRCAFVFGALTPASWWARRFLLALALHRRGHVYRSTVAT